MSSQSAHAQVAKPSSRWHVLIPLLTVLIAAVYGAAFVQRGWIAFDEGMLGQAAERVLHGELPHRDFDETYSGGLSYLHALAFQFLGERLSSPRWVLYAFFLLLVPLLYALARRVAPPWLAGLVTLLGVALSFPNYFAALPSWYHLIGTAGGTWALLRFLDSGRSRWLFLAGACGGLITLIKVSGLYYLAAGLLFLVYTEQQSWSGECEDNDNAANRSWAFAGFKGLAIFLFMALHLTFISALNPVMDLVFFVVPDWTLSLVVLAGEWRLGPTPLGTRLSRLVRRIGPLLLGYGVVVSVLIVPYLLQGGLADLYQGVLVRPRLRKDFAQLRLPSLSFSLLCIPWSFLLLAVGQRPLPVSLRSILPKIGVLTVIAVALAYTLFAWKAYQTDMADNLFDVLGLTNAYFLYQYLFEVLRLTTPVLVLFSCVYGLMLSGPADILPRAEYDAIPRKRREEVFLLLAMAAQVTLLQFPFAFPTYFLYGVPLVVLAWLYVVETQAAPPRVLHLAALVFFLLYAVLWLNTTRSGLTGVFYERADLVPLSLERADLAVQRVEAEVYEELIPAIQAIAEPGEPIWASPDCPEIYFLSATRNPTRTLFDFLEADEPDRTKRILSMLQRLSVRLVVINEEPRFSRPLDPELRGAIEQRYPEERRIGPFTLRYRGKTARPHRVAGPLLRWDNRIDCACLNRVGISWRPSETERPGGPAGPAGTACS